MTGMNQETTGNVFTFLAVQPVRAVMPGMLKSLNSVIRKTVKINRCLIILSLMTATTVNRCLRRVSRKHCRCVTAAIHGGKASGYGYKKVRFVPDRGCFSKGNIHLMDKCGYDFAIMVKGMKKFVNEMILENKERF